MSVPKSIILIIALGLVLGCASKTPLPEGELPNDFLFVFTFERLTEFDATVELTADGEVVGEADGEDADGEDADSEDADSEDADGEDADSEDADSEDADGEDADGEDADGEDADGEDADETEEPEEGESESPDVKEAPPPAGADETESGMDEENGEEPEMGEENGEGTEPEMGEESAEGTEPEDGEESAEDEEADGEEAGEETVTLPLPSFVKVVVDVVGRTDIEITHMLPRENTSRQTITLSREDLMELYQLIRAADIYNLPEIYEDGDWKKGKETYSVIGRNKPRTVTVTGTEVEELLEIREYLFSLLPVKDLLTLPAVIERLVIMDRRSGVFYRAEEDAVQEIPEQYRKEYKDPWKALDDGGFPSPSFGPLPKEWD